MKVIIYDMNDGSIYRGVDIEKLRQNELFGSPAVDEIKEKLKTQDKVEYSSFCVFKE